MRNRFHIVRRAGAFLALAAAASVSLAQSPQWNAAEQQKLLPPLGNSAADECGTSVAISGDVAVVGAPLDDPIASASGLVYVFRRSGATWNLEQQLTPINPGSPANPAEGNDQFGISVDVEGNTIVVGCWGDNQPATDAGSAYVFVWNGASWVQRQILTASNATSGDLFGYDVAIGGGVIVCGAYADDPGAKTDAGSAYVFGRVDGGTPLDPTDDTWCQQANLAPATLLANDQFGYAVAVSESGNRVAVGAWLDDVVATGDSGSVYVFGRGDNGTPANPCDDTWTQEGSNVVNLSNASFDYFGHAIALEDDTMLVGAYGDDHDSVGGLGDCGSFVLVERVAGPAWAPLTKHYASDAGASDVLAYEMSLDGDTLVVGAHGDNGVLANNDEGAAYVFRRNTSGVWQQQLKLIASDGSIDDYFGLAVAAGGDYVAVGAPYDDLYGGSAGTPYMFEIQRDRFATFCHGDGSGVACPCANNSVVGAAQGCKNSLARGATLRPGGSTSIGADDFALYATNLPIGNACVLFAGMSGNAGIPFFAGLKCVPPPTIRLGVKIASTTGYVSYGPDLNNGTWSAGQTWHFQLWYRDPSFTGCSPAKTTNVTNGVQVTF